MKRISSTTGGVRRQESSAQPTPRAPKQPSKTPVSSQPQSRPPTPGYSHVKSRVDTGRHGASKAPTPVVSASQTSSSSSSLSSQKRVAAAPVRAVPSRPAVTGPKSSAPSSQKVKAAGAAAAQQGNSSIVAGTSLFSIRPQVSYEEFFGDQRNSLHDHIVAPTTLSQQKQKQLQKPEKDAAPAANRTAESLVVSESTYRHHSSVMTSVSWQTYVLDEAPDLPPIHVVGAAAASGADQERSIVVLDAPQVSRIADRSTDSQLSNILEFHRPSRASIVLAALEQQPSPQNAAKATTLSPSGGDKEVRADAVAEPAALLSTAVPTTIAEGRGSFRRSTTLLPQPPNSPTSGAKDPQSRPSRSAGGSGWFSSILSLISGGSIEQEAVPVAAEQNEEAAPGREATPPSRSSSKRSRSKVIDDGEDEAPPRRSNKKEGDGSSVKATPSASKAAGDDDDEWRAGTWAADDASPVPQPPKLQGGDDDAAPLAETPLTPLAPPSAAEKTNWFKKAVQRLSGSRMSEDLARVSEGPRRRKSVVFTEQLEVVAAPAVLLTAPAPEPTAPVETAAAGATSGDESIVRKSATLSPKTSSSASPRSKAASTPSQKKKSATPPSSAKKASSASPKEQKASKVTSRSPSSSPLQVTVSPSASQSPALVSPASRAAAKSITSPREGSAVGDAELEQVSQTIRASSAASIMRLLTVKQIAAFLASQQISFDPEKKKAQLVALARRAAAGSSVSKSRSRTATQPRTDADDDDEVIDDGPGSPHFRQNEAPSAAWTVAELKSYAAVKGIKVDANTAKRKADLLQAILSNGSASQ